MQSGRGVGYGNPDGRSGKPEARKAARHREGHTDRGDRTAGLWIRPPSTRMASLARPGEPVPVSIRNPLNHTRGRLFGPSVLMVRAYWLTLKIASASFNDFA